MVNIAFAILFKAEKNHSSHLFLDNYLTVKL